MAVRLLGDCSWSTTVTEQQHASVKQIQRHHPDYELNTLMVRSGLHSLRRLVPERTEQEKLQDRLELKVNQLLAKQHTKAHGRLIFLKEAIETAKAQYKAQGK
eukprot:1485133-Lingulodinium_polyedra.AAC.1